MKIEAIEVAAADSSWPADRKPCLVHVKTTLGDLCGRVDRGLLIFGSCANKDLLPSKRCDVYLTPTQEIHGVASA